jgi:hypothetical protein
MQYQIWSDNELEASWFADLHDELTAAPVKIIQSRGANPKIIDDLVIYDRPDIILLKNGVPVLVLEKTREVPTGHNVGQRVARLVRAAEFKVPTIFFLPFDARKHGKYTSICSINTRLIRAMLAMTKIHECPVLPVSWPCDPDGNLVTDGSEDNGVKALVKEILNPGSQDGSIEAYKRTLLLDLQRRESVYPNYRELPTSANIVRTSGLDLALGDSPGSRRIKGRVESLVYKMDMSPDKCKRQDPYTGMQFIYDYAWLRTGKSPSHRTKNLLLHIPNVTKAQWLKANPNDVSTKSCNWYLTADAIVLSDGVIVIEDWPLHHE